MATLLENVRILDLTDQKGFLCGRVLADLGADVIKVEKPGGDPDRMVPPFINDVPGVDRSLSWMAFNCNKRGITLDINSPQGKALFKRLVQGADVVIESFAPGFLDQMDLGYDGLSRTNSRCILTSISPFGQTGPYRGYKGSDLVCYAQSGWLNLCGDPDRPPVRIAAPQAYLNAGAEAAMGTMFALWGRGQTGWGQHVDVSAQQSMIVNSFQAVSFWELNQVILRRAGPYRTGLTAGVKQRQTWPCKGGFINFSIIGGKAGSKTNASLVQWLNSEGTTVTGLETTDWETFDMATVTQEQLGHMDEAFARFFLTHTREELYEGALKRGIMLCPVNNAQDIFESTQLEARGFWDKLEHPSTKLSMRYPGKIIDVPGADVSVRLSAPQPGEHNEQVFLDELEIGRPEFDRMVAMGVI